MAKLLQTLIPVLALVVATATTTARSQVTSFAFDFYGDQPSELIYQGDAHFPSNPNHSTYLRMTESDTIGDPLPHRAGRAVYSKPVQFWGAGAQVDFESTLKFLIKGVNPLKGDGFTFFIRPVGSPPGTTGGGFGIFSSDSAVHTAVFAVEFDIYVNAGVDPDYPHVGIDIGSNVSKNTTDVGDALDWKEVTARINYQQASKLISVVMNSGSDTFEVSYVYDLSTFLPQQVEVGISASTGDAVAIHDLMSWYFTSTLVQTNRAYV